MAFPRCAVRIMLGAILLDLIPANAGTTNAKSASFVDVAAAIGLAKDGDTVAVPAGAASWTSTLTITKSITLQGAANDKTIILDDIARDKNRKDSANVGQPPGARLGQPQSRAGRPLFAHAGPLSARERSQKGQSNRAIVRVELTPRHSFRLTGFTFRCGSVTSANDGAVVLSGTCPSVRVDHCHFDQLYTGHNIEIFGWLYGVIDHCIFDIRNGIGGGTTATAMISHANWGNGVSGWGSWADPPYFGSEKFIFLEDNMINNLSPAPNGGSIDAARGGRYVARQNTFSNSTIFYHGSDSGAGGVYFRGARAVEIYDNKFKSSRPMHPGGQCRGGSLLWYDNTYTGTIKNGMSLRVYRLYQGGAVRPGIWGAANGANPWDCNATERDGTHVGGHEPYTFAAGTHVGSNDATAVTVSGAPWQPDQWAGYSVTNTTSNSPYFNGCNYITSNTSNTLTMGGFGDRPFPKFNTGDTFAIHKVLIILDQPGRGQDGVGERTNFPASIRPSWPHQALEPCYSWHNSLNGANLNFANIPGKNLLRENVDYYNNRPMPGYKPYTYPHPLVTAGSKD